MASLWWEWDRLTSVATIYDVRDALKANKSYKDVTVQKSGDVFARKGSVDVGVVFLYDGYIPPPPPPNFGPGTGTSNNAVGANIYWRGIVCSGASKSEADVIFKEIKATTKGIFSL